jgi:hypothetical protein
MKPIVLATLVAALLVGSTEALAGNGGYHGGYNGHGGNYKHGGYYGHGGGYYYRPGYYRYPYYGYPYYGYHQNNNNYNNGVYYALGGLVLGSILTNTYYQNRVATQPVYVQQTYQPARVVVPQGRHLVRDLNGNCFERTTDAAGNELRTELPPADCNW